MLTVSFVDPDPNRSLTGPKSRTAASPLTRCSLIRYALGPARGQRMQINRLRRREFISLLGGAAAAWPLATRAQTGKQSTIGFLGTTTALAWEQWTAVFLERLRELGWIEGRNLAIEYRWAEARRERFAESQSQDHRAAGRSLGLNQCAHDHSLRPLGWTGGWTCESNPQQCADASLMLTASQSQGHNLPLALACQLVMGGVTSCTFLKR
jgi:hypothetical protein